MRTLCLTISEAAVEAASNLARLVESLEQQDADIDLVVVMRGGDRYAPARRGRVVVHQLASPRRIGLSAARNIALRHARDTGLLGRADMVAFPDDDCSYPAGLLRRAARELGGADLVAGCYAPAVDAVDPARFPLRDATLTPGLVMRAGSSCTMFLTGAAARRVGDFDEAFGLGARFGASEDADFLLRALQLGLDARYRPADIVVLHPYKPHRAAQYYVGNVAVLAKHARGGGTGRLLARRLLGGLLMTLRSQLDPRELRRAVATSLSVVRTSPETSHAR